MAIHDEGLDGGFTFARELKQVCGIEFIGQWFDAQSGNEFMLQWIFPRPQNDTKATRVVKA